MAPVVGDTSTISDEEYLVLRAKDALKSDPYAAKAWMLTAKTLFPNNFAVQVRNAFDSPAHKLLKYIVPFDIRPHRFTIRVG
jgi:integrator complex subunit 10